MAYITAENLKYHYPHQERLALNGLSFTIEKGELIGVIGASGAGKSTLCSAFNGLVPHFYRGAYGGRLVIEESGKGELKADKAGTDAAGTAGPIVVAQTPVAELCKKVGLVFQNPFNQLTGASATVYGEIAFGLQNLGASVGLTRDDIHERVREVMKLLDITALRERNPYDLSGGQMQRVALAGILVMQPEILVLDEPTSQLDPAAGEEVFRAVEKLKQSGITIIMAEQKMEKLDIYCDRIILLHRGGMVAFDTPERIFSRPDLLTYGICPPLNYLPVPERIAAVPAFSRTADTASVDAVFTDVVSADAVFTEGVSADAVFTDAVSADSGTVSASTRSATGTPKQPGTCPPPEIFTVRDLTFSYQSAIPVLRGLNLRLDTRPTAIVGQNGAGKTTLVKLLKKLLLPESGSIFYQNTDISQKTVAMLAGEIGYVFQNPDDQIFKYQVLDEVMFGPLNIGMSRQQARERALWALEMTGLAEMAAVNPYDLELAQRKMTSIASVLAMDTAVLILDEPTIAQDYRGREILKAVVRKLTAAGKTVISVLHDMDFVYDCFERVIVMKHGQVIGDGPGEEIFRDRELLYQAGLEQPAMIRFWGGRPETGC